MGAPLLDHLLTSKMTIPYPSLDRIAHHNASVDPNFERLPTPTPRKSIVHEIQSPRN